MEAGSCCCYMDYNPIEPRTDYQRKARKEHKCYECEDKIKKGEKYWVHQGQCDDYWLYVKNCNFCEQLRQDYCGPIGDLRIHILECLEFDYTKDPQTYRI